MAIHLRNPYHPVYRSVDRPALTQATAAILGGDTPYLHPAEDWPQCPSCAHSLIPLVQVNLSSSATPEEFCSLLGFPNLTGETMVMLQLFVCPDDDSECLHERLSDMVEGQAWVLRLAHFSRSDLVQESVEHEPAVETLSHADHKASIAPSSFSPTFSKQQEQARAALHEKKLFRPERIIDHWVMGKPEMEHWEDTTKKLVEFEEEFYDHHEPFSGLKLLGYNVSGGKYSCGSWVNGHVNDTPDCTWRNLIQLGTENTCDEEGLQLVTTVGNWWIMVCDAHPSLLELGVNGSW